MISESAVAARLEPRVASSDSPSPLGSASRRLHGTRRARRTQRPDHRGDGQAFWIKWTRTQRIRTAGALPLEVALLDTAERPVYQRIASKALHLRELGLSDRVIAQRLGVSDKTVGKAIQWLGGLSP